MRREKKKELILMRKIKLENCIKKDRGGQTEEGVRKKLHSAKSLSELVGAAVERQQIKKILYRKRVTETKKKLGKDIILSMIRGEILNHPHR